MPSAKDNKKKRKAVKKTVKAAPKKKVQKKTPQKIRSERVNKKKAAGKGAGKTAPGKRSKAKIPARKALPVRATLKKAAPAVSILLAKKAKLAPHVVAKIKLLSGQKKKFYDLLMKGRIQVLNQIKFLSEEALPSGATTGEHSSTMTNHMADYGSDNFLHGMELDMMTGEMEDLEMIDEAVERLISGEYGKCQDCGCQIPVERLEVKPYAKFCVKCKTLREGKLTRPDLER